MTDVLIAAALVFAALLGWGVGYAFAHGHERERHMAYVYRARAIQLRLDEVHDRSEAAAKEQNVGAMEDALAEAQLLVANLREVRLEQLQQLTEEGRRE